MGIYARRNFLIANFGPNVLLTQPVADGQTLVYDAQLGSFINAPGQPAVTAINLGTGVGVFENQSGNQLQFNSLKAGPNVNISKNNGEIMISANVSGAGVVIVVEDMAERDQIAPSLTDGSLVFVRDDGRGNHEFALFMWSSAVGGFIQIATTNSAESAANTVTFTLNANSPSDFVICNVAPGHKVVHVDVEVLVPFNGVNPTISVGDDIHGNSVHMTIDQNDLVHVGDYTSESGLVYTGVLETDVKGYFNSGGSLVGQALIVVTYV